MRETAYILDTKLHICVLLLVLGRNNMAMRMADGRIALNEELNT